ncbi:TorD/DmsD family molecular chaperone [Candidatus Thiosymbion oneisti]|uniref:TorD/DmsD family molecular chaperone n=1 Tax=Candidatus Thiosymbion oneisti TaxID=589554 RepID=UPI00210E198E|nr:molecular chaperone TorD family protein [Candidatus Thiosymbion oneisti]
MTLASTDPNQLRILAALLAMPEDDALDALRDMRPQAPWLEPSLPELERIPLEHWQAEHTRLFISAYPKLPCPPYESAYRQGTMVGVSASELADLYRRAGLQAMDVPADYLGTLLECAAYLKETGRDELLRELTEEHLALWVPRFARDLVDHARLDFYRTLGRQIGALIPESPDHE